MQTIRTGFRTAVVAGAILVAGALVAFAISQWMFTADSSQSESLRRVSDEGVELVQLTHAVLQYPGARSIGQWQHQYVEFDRLLSARNSAADPDIAPILDQARLRLRTVRAITDKLLSVDARVGGDAASAEIAAILSAQLFQEATQLQATMKALRTTSTTSLEQAYELARRRQIWMFLGFTLLGLLFWGVMSLAVRRWVLAPLGELEQTIGLLRAGKRQRAQVMRNDEIGAICATFNRLLDEQESAKVTLHSSEVRYRALIEASAQIVWSCNADGEAVEDSPSWRSYTGQSVDEWLHFGYMNAIHPDDCDAVMARWREALTSGQQATNIYRLHHDVSGEWRWNEARAVPIRGTDGKIGGWVGMNTDIHDRETAEQALHAAKDAAEAANVAKSRFLATMSHEIRTPMNGILGMAQLLLMPELKEAERQEYVRVVINSGQTLLTLLNDILDLSKIEAGRVELESLVFEPAQLIHEVAALFAEQAHAKGLTVEVVWSGTQDVRYRADSVRLRQMLSNLVGNAIKFTSQGFIRIEGRNVGTMEQDVPLEFAIVDSGIGIPEEKQALLFRPFSQVDASTTRKYGGTGLGLSIVRNLARLMGGDVEVESEPGQGTRIWFRIRANRVKDGDESRQTARDIVALAPSVEVMAPTSAHYVLVVEDNATNRMVIEAILKKHGIRFESTGNGQEAVERITAGVLPDLVLMDCQMPVMDGYEATRRIRQWEQEGNKPRLPIIALTASAYAEDRNHCLTAGMDDFLTKPIDVLNLKTALLKWLS